jgi:hypothetical protein
VKAWAYVREEKYKEAARQLEALVLFTGRLVEKWKSATSFTALRWK